MKLFRKTKSPAQKPLAPKPKLILRLPRKRHSTSIETGVSNAYMKKVQNTSLSRWDNLTLAVWVKYCLNMPTYFETVVVSQITGHDIISYSDANLKTLGITSAADRRIILSSVKERVHKDIRASSEPVLTPRSIEKQISALQESNSLFQASSSSLLDPRDAGTLLRFKFALEGECRVVMLPPSVTFEELYDKVITIFGKPMGMVYTDSDRDVIEIRKTVDISDAISQSLTSSIKIHVYPITPTSSPNTPLLPPASFEEVSESKTHSPSQANLQSQTLQEDFENFFMSPNDFQTNQSRQQGQNQSAQDQLQVPQAVDSPTPQETPNKNEGSKPIQKTSVRRGSSFDSLTTLESLGFGDVSSSLTTQASLLEDIVAPAMVISSTGLIFLWNQHAVNFFGYSIPNIVGHNMSMLIAPEFQREHQKFLTRLSNTRNTPRQTTESSFLQTQFFGHKRRIQVVTSNESSIPIDISVTPCDDIAFPTYLCEFTPVVPKKPKTEKKSVKTDFTIFKSFSHPILIVDHHGDIVFANNPVSVFTRYPKSSLVGSTAFVIIPEPFRSLHSKYFADHRLIDGILSHRVMNKILKLPVLRKDGVFVQANITLSEIRQSKDTVLYMISLMPHIIPTIQLPVITFEDQCKSICSKKNPTLLINHLSLITCCNSSAEIEFGFTSEEIVGRQLHSLFHETISHLEMRLFFLELYSSNSLQSFEDPIPLISKTGDPLRVSVQSQSFLTPAGSSAFVLFLHPIRTTTIN